MDVALLYFDDCSNWKVAEQRLAVIAAERRDVVLTRHRAETLEDAERLGFHGSPSILVDGVDIFAEPDAAVGCRVGSIARPTAWQGRRRRSSCVQRSACLPSGPDTWRTPG